MKLPNDQTSVSIIINNYNYGRFLKASIDSALDQNYPIVEVIVVDDGSSDQSVDIIKSYGDRVLAVLKENGGQASAFNEGFVASSGDVIIFLDSDDLLMPHAASVAVTSFNDQTTGNISKLHWNLMEIDINGNKNGKIFPDCKLPEGNLLQLMIKNGPDGYPCVPTTGNAWSSRFLKEVFPIPAEAFRLCADFYLFMLAPLYGDIKAIHEPLSLYRIHGTNNWNGKMSEASIKTLVKVYNSSCAILKERLSEIGVNTSDTKWKDTSWYYLILDAINDIKTLIEEGKKFILVDEDWLQTKGVVSGRISIPFTENQGKYWGPPVDDLEAIAEIEKQITNGATAILFLWPAFWWLQHYKELNTYLRSQYDCIIENERFIGFTFTKLTAIEKALGNATVSLNNLG